MFRKEFADIITKTGMVPLKDFRECLRNKDPGIISEFELLKLNYFDDSKFAKIIATKHSMTFIDLFNAKIAQRTIELIKKKDVFKYRCIPIQKKSGVVTVAVYDPSIANVKNELATVFQANIEIILTNITSWKKLFERVTQTVEELVSSIHEVEVDSDKSETKIKEEDIGEEIIQYVNRVFAEAYLRKASDIHIEPYEESFRIRFRVDGRLVEFTNPPMGFMLPMISRIKIMAQMDISEKRKPLDGRIKIAIGGAHVDYRVSSLPTLYGEKVVLRILDKSSLEVDMTKLGFEKKQLEVFKNGIFQPYGMCLVTGPTGSGKTTTLYSALQELNNIRSNISTAEDPVEYNLHGINQVNIRKEVGLTFASALKAFLRQDPDIIMVGEIRDLEVGEIAVEAALTGHLVLSTLHTNDAPSTIARLLNMGIEPFLVTGSLNVIVAQRLCRMICSQCKEVDSSIKKEQLIACGIAPTSAEKMKVYKGVGCDYCNDLGFKGRIAIYEVMEISPMIKEIILRNGSADDLKKQAIKEGMKTLRMTALTKVAQGMTTLEEAITNSSTDKF